MSRSKVGFWEPAMLIRDIEKTPAVRQRAPGAPVDPRSFVPALDRIGPESAPGKRTPKHGSRTCFDA